MGKYNDFNQVIPTPEVIGKIIRMYRGEELHAENGWHAIRFDNAHYATSFWTVNHNWTIKLPEPITKLHNPCVLLVQEAAHSENICLECNGCKRNACEPHRLCRC